MKKLKNLIIDMDGVLYRGKTPLPYSKEFIEFLKKRGYKFMLLTNNSSKTQKEYQRKLLKMKIKVDENQILTSSVAISKYLSKIKPCAKIYVIGERGLYSELEKRGFEITKKDPDFVVVGWDRRFNFEKLNVACRLIRKGAEFYATNTDSTYPQERGLLPGCGALVAAVQECAGVKPHVVGKPNPYIINLALNMMEAEKEESAIIGDRIATDILAGVRSGIKTILILTGIEDKKSLKESRVKPDFVFKDLVEILEWLKKKV
ncbi:MAG: HAD-IIA family hydrolase [Candidatus Methanofastidiosia archaeon]